MLLFFIFAALGVELFGDLSKDAGKPDKEQTAIGGLTSHSVQAPSASFSPSVNFICMTLIALRSLWLDYLTGFSNRYRWQLLRNTIAHLLLRCPLKKSPPCSFFHFLPVYPLQFVMSCTRVKVSDATPHSKTLGWRFCCSSESRQETTGTAS